MMIANVQKVIWTVLLGLTTNIATAQLVQTIRGTVADAQTGEFLIGATIEINNSTNQYGGITDEDGVFRIGEIEIGRYNIICSYLGYEPIVMNQVEVTSSKQVVVALKMTEVPSALKTSVLHLKKDKRKIQNNIVSVSGRTFSIEESQRYAGSRGDVARMAQNFAGVQGADDFRNDIIVRGNSPIGVLYRVDGVDIPNPNHFAAVGTTGGPVSMLNNNVLKNSDFLTGAYPSEFGNTTSAVFDLGLRSGNNEKHEFLGQIGFAGFELMAEGPISKKSKSSYLINYRYSVLGVFQTLGIDFGTGAAIPQYQDLTMKLNFPDKSGATSLFSIGGISSIDLFQSESSQESAYGDDFENLRFKTNTGVFGLTRKQRLGTKTVFKFTYAIDAVQTQTTLDTFALDNGNIINYAGLYRDDSKQGKHSIIATLTHKYNSKHSLKAGFRYYNYFFSLKDSVYSRDYDFWVEPADFKGNTGLVQSYVNHRMRISNRLKVNVGLNYARFDFNGAASIEPRFGLKYKFNSQYEVSFGYGLHSLLPPFRIYFEDVTDSLGNKRSVNQDLGFTKSHHFVLSNDFYLTKSSRLKIEAYYQHMFDVPTDGGGDAYYSLLNQGVDFGILTTDDMRNAGTGRNYGLEFTYEHFLSKGFYFLNTISIYRSLYTAQDKVEYPTVFDSKYAFNVLGGKEFYFKSKVNKKGKTTKSSLTVDLKLVVNGGRRHSPVNVDQSIAEQDVVYVNSRTNELQYKEYGRFDIRLAYKVQSKKISQEWGIDIQNISNRKNIFSTQYDIQDQQYNTTYQTGLFPVGIYRITF